MLLAGLAFFVSGAAALVYQVAWQRLLALQTGVGAWSVAVIVASFMAGLGAGSHLGGVLSTRLEPRRALFAFVGLELVIGVFGVASCGLYYDLLYLRAPSLFASPVLGGFVQFVSLLPPTLLMGMSLPFLVRGLLRDVGTAGRVVGFLYGINTIGAGVGALVAPWVLLRHLGVRGALVAAALANLVAALLALLLALDRRPAPIAAEPVAGPPIEETRHPFGLWLCALCLLGLLRPVSRGPLVPDRGRGGEGVRLHLRHGARDLPLRAGEPERSRGRRGRIGCDARSWSS